MHTKFKALHASLFLDHTCGLHQNLKVDFLENLIYPCHRSQTGIIFKCRNFMSMQNLRQYHKNR